MSRPIELPCDSGPWIFPKYDALSLMSSVYATDVPYFFVNWSSVGRRFVFSLTSM